MLRGTSDSSVNRYNPFLPASMVTHFFFRLPLQESIRGRAENSHYVLEQQFDPADYLSAQLISMTSNESLKMYLHNSEDSLLKRHGTLDPHDH